jgi:hypothetical protein
MVLKLDFQKAFDTTVHWKALIHTLQERGFPARWIKWIEHLLYTSRAQLLINGNIGEKFTIQRGSMAG